MQNKLQSIFEQYQGDASDLIPILQHVQDQFGYVPPDAINATANYLCIPESKAYGVVTFYKQFYLTPQGRHRIKVCQGTACHVRGSKEVLDAIIRELGIGPGETTADCRVSLESVACLGACALAPAIVVDDTVHGRITPQKSIEILDGLE